jgi:hypothetical protein
MQNVPKVVLERLRSAAAEPHPDADLLTAFAERSLAGREREQVVEHLARCGDCRDVVALALPAQIELPMPVVSRANWFRWPVLRWAAVAAGVVLIASIGTVHYRGQHSSELASNVFSEKQAISAPAQSSQRSSQVAVPKAGMRKDVLAAPRAQIALAEKKAAPPAGAVFHGRAYSAGASGGGSAGAALGGSVNGLIATPRRDLAFAPAPQSPTPAATAKQDASPGATRQTVEVSGASQMAEVQSEVVQVGTPTATQNRIQDQAVQNEPAEQSSADQWESVGKAKPALAQASPAMGSAPLQGANSSLMKSLGTLRWTISSTGALQRSLDGGNTWLDVNVAVDNSAVDESVSANLMRRAEAKAETKAETKASAKSRAASYGAPPAVKSADAAPAPSASTIFRALSVSSNAAEVWAGGSGGALYHTVDGGNRWSRVVPSAAGIVLAGDIISIQFSDPRSGSVTTSNAEVWTTVDDGQTWHRQQ